MGEHCIWYYRPGVNSADHFAVASCDHQMKYLSKIRGRSQEVHCADDIYNGRHCPACGHKIIMDYSSIEGGSY